MATYTKIVDPNGNGANYTSLSTWEAGEQTLYASGDIAIADCKRTGATKDTTAITIAGWTSGVIPKIIVNAAYRHEGKWADQRGDGNYIYTLRPTNNFNTAILSTTVSNGVIEGILVDCGAGSNIYGVRNELGYVINCIVKDVKYVSTTETFAAIIAKYISNCIAYNNAGVGICVYEYTVGYIYNCTAYRNKINFSKTNANSHVIKNCVGLYSVDANADFKSFSAGSDYNVSSDATAPGTNKATGKTAYTDYFVDPANGDFHLKASSLTLWGLSGADLSGTFTTDSDGQTRTGAWDIGADQYVAAGGGAITGTSSITLEAITPTAAGALTITGQSSAVLDMLTQVSTGTARISAGSAITLADVTGIASATVLTRGQAINALADLIGTGIGVTAIVGSQASILAALTGTSSGAVAVAGQSTQTLADVTGTATATIGNVISGSGSVTLDDLIASMTGTARVTGASSATLADLTGTGTGTVSLTAAQSQMLLDTIASAAGTVTVTGNSATVLAALTQVAAAYIGDDVPLEPGPHEIVILLSPITRTVHQASVVTRTVNRSSEVH